MSAGRNTFGVLAQPQSPRKRNDEYIFCIVDLNTSLSIIQDIESVDMFGRWATYFAVNNVKHP